MLLNLQKVNCYKHIMQVYNYNCEFFPQNYLGGKFYEDPDLSINLYDYPVSKLQKVRHAFRNK